MYSTGEKIKQIRIARNMTQQELADTMGVKRNTISQWESGARKISVEQLIELAKTVGVTLDYFQDDPPERALFQALTQLESAFSSADIPSADKDKAFKEIADVYFKFKEIANVKHTQVPKSEKILHLKEE